MLCSAGFIDVEETDVTTEYEITARGWLEGRERYHDELKRSMGEAALTEKIEEGKAHLQAIEDGLLGRSLLAARRPGP